MANTPLEFPWAAKKRYMRPCLPFHACTVYKSSYLNNCEDNRRCPLNHPDNGNLISMGATTDGLSCYGASYEPTEGHVNLKRLEQVKPDDNLRTGVGDMAGQTITQMSFPGWSGIAPQVPFPSSSSNLIGSGPMSEVTTTRHDYTCKGAPKQTITKAEDQIKISNMRMAGDSTAQMSYKEPDHRYFERSQSYQPKREFQPPESPMANTTTSRMSYVPIAAPPQEEYPWMAKKKYAAPDTAMEGASTYNKSYLNNCEDFRRCPLNHPDNGNLISMGATTDGLSCYGASYEPTEGHVNLKRLEQVKPDDNLRTGVGDMAGQTITQMSFPGWSGIAPQVPFPSSSSNLIGSGPMSEVTTTRHDYTCKGAPKQEITKAEDQIKISNMRMAGQSTAAMSFLEPDMTRFQAAKSFKPQTEFIKDRPPFQAQTVARMSFTGEQPPGPFIIASKSRRAQPPLSEEERRQVCSPGASVPQSRQMSRVPSRQQAMARLPSIQADPEFEICRPQECPSGAPQIPNIKDFMQK